MCVAGAGTAAPVIEGVVPVREAAGEIVVVREDECYEGLRGSV
jgi:hypothetical protein